MEGQREREHQRESSSEGGGGRQRKERGLWNFQVVHYLMGQSHVRQTFGSKIRIAEDNELLKATRPASIYPPKNAAACNQQLTTGKSPFYITVWMNPSDTEGLTD